MSIKNGKPHRVTVADAIRAFHELASIEIGDDAPADSFSEFILWCLEKCHGDAIKIARAMAILSGVSMDYVAIRWTPERMIEEIIAVARYNPGLDSLTRLVFKSRNNKQQVDGNYAE